jgi:hypothetical protein
VYKLDTLVQQIVAMTGLPCHIALDKSPERRVGSQDQAYVTVAYDRITSPHEADVLLDSASEVGNQLLCLTKVTLFARPEQYSEVWMALYQACLHFQPEFPVPSHQPLTFVFVDCEFYEDSGLWVSVNKWSYLFDRFWLGGNCVPAALDPTSLYNPATIMLP